MTERKTIKTEYSKLNECLEKLGIREYISGGWHEVKVEEEDHDCVTMIRPVRVKDLVALFKMVTDMK